MDSHPHEQHNQGGGYRGNYRGRGDGGARGSYRGRDGGDRGSDRGRSPGFHTAFSQRMVKAGTNFVGDPLERVLVIPYEGQSSMTIHDSMSKHQFVIAPLPPSSLQQDAPEDDPTISYAADFFENNCARDLPQTSWRWKVQFGVMTVLNWELSRVAPTTGDVADCSLEMVAQIVNAPSQNIRTNFVCTNFLSLESGVALMSSKGAASCGTTDPESIADYYMQYVAGYLQNALGAEPLSDTRTLRLQFKKIDEVDCGWQPPPPNNDEGVPFTQEMTLTPDSSELHKNVVFLPRQSSLPCPDDKALPLAFRMQAKSMCPRDPIRIRVHYDGDGTPVDGESCDGSQLTYSRTQRTIELSYRDAIVAVTLYRERESRGMNAVPQRLLIELRRAAAVAPNDNGDVGTQDAAKASWLRLVGIANTVAGVFSALPRDLAKVVRYVSKQNLCLFEEKHGSCMWPHCRFEHRNTICIKDALGKCSRGLGTCNYQHWAAELRQRLVAYNCGSNGDGGLPASSRAASSRSIVSPLPTSVCRAPQYVLYRVRDAYAEHIRRLVHFVGDGVFLSDDDGGRGRGGSHHLPPAHGQRAFDLKMMLDVLSTFCAEVGQIPFVSPSPSDEQSVKSFAVRNYSSHALRLSQRLRAGLPALATATACCAWARDAAQRFLVVVGETGSGKSTQIPQYLADVSIAQYVSAAAAAADGVCDGRRKVVYCTQPRAVAARSLAMRVAEEFDRRPGTVGHRVGFHTGGRRALGPNCALVFITERSLIQLIANQKFNPERVFAVVVDEAHERSINCDLLLGLLKEASLASSMKLVVASATLDTALFMNFLGPGCTLLRIPGRMFPVEVHYRPRSIDADGDYVQLAVDEIVSIIRRDDDDDNDDGDCMRDKRDDGNGRKRSPRNGILCFLTSPDELEDAAAAVQEALSDSQRATIRTFLLSGRQSAEEQQDVFKPCDVRKVVFATHIAETSVTINEIEYVIDCGLARTLSFDQVRNDNALVRQAISRSSAEQRKGRAGRTAPGVCIRLYSALEYDTLAPCPTSAILASPLHIAYLRLLQLRRTESPSPFGWVQSPPSAAWERTRQDLLLLGAISAGHGARGEVVTPLGAFAVDLELDNVFIAAFLYHCYEADVNSAALSYPLLTYGLTAASIILNAQTLLCWSKQRPEDSDKAHGELAAKWNASEYGDVLVALRAFTEYVGLEPPQPVASRQPANSNHHVDPALCRDAAPTDTVVDATEMGEDVSKPVEEENDDEDDDDKLLLRGATLHTKQEAWCKQSYFRFRGVNAVIKRRGELVGSLHLNRLSIENRDVISLRKHRTATCTSSPTDHELKTLRQLLAKSFMMQAAVRVGVTRFRTLTDDETFPSRSGFVVKIDEALPDVVVFASNLRTTRSHMIFMTPLTDEDLTAVVPSSVREQIVAMLDTRQAQRIVNVPSTVVASVHPKQLAKRIGGDAPQPFITLEEDNTAVIHAQQGRMEALLKNLEGFLDEEKQRSMRQVREVPLNGQCRIAVGAGGAMKGFLADDTTFISISMTTKQPTFSGCDSTMALSILENARVPFETVGRIRPVRSGNCPIIVDFVSSRDAAVALAALRHSDDVAAACPLIDVAPLGAPWNNCKLLVSIRLIVELSSASDFETADDAATGMAPISDEALEHVIAALKRLFPHEERTSVDYEPHAKRLVLSACLEEEGSLSRARELTSMFKELEVIDSCQRFSSFTTFTVRVPLPLKCQLKPLCAMLVRRLRDHKQGLRAACRTCEIGGARYIEVSGTDRNDALQAAEFVSRSCEWSDIALRPEDVSLFCSKHMWQFLRSVLVQRKPKGDIESPMFVVDYETRRVMFLGRSDKSAAAQTCIAEVVAAMRTDGHIDTTQCRLSKSAKPHMVRQAIEALRKRCDKSTIVWRGKYLEVVTTAANKDELIKSLGKNIDAINGVSVAHHRTSAPCRAPQRQAASCDDCSLCMDQLQASQLRLALCGCAFCTDCFANMISSPPLALPIQCPGCSCLVAVQDIEAVVPNALVWIAEQQRSLSLGGPNIDASGVTSDNGGALWMPCPQMSCQGVIALGDGLSPFAHCYGCGTAFCRTCQAAGVVRELHEGPCVTEKESALAHVLTPIHALMERRCPHPSCREVFLDFDGCFAVTCGACKKQFCGFCMEACAGDAHPHVTNCTRNPKPGNVFCQESVFEQLREEDACTAIHTYVEENRVPQCFYADIVADINKRLTSSARLSLDDICCVAASTSRRIEGSRVASECELVVTKVRNQDKLREVIEGALSALREADPSSAFKFSVCDFADVGNGTNALHTAVGELQKVLPGACLGSDVLEPHASSVDAEQVAVRMYTSNQFFEELNRILRSHVRLTPTSFKCLQPYMALLLRGVARCTTRSPIIVYRGMKLTTSQQKTYEEGRTVLWRNLVSCTTDPTVAQSFGNVLFEIHLHASADISHWSLVPSENEVLVPPRTRLRVASVSTDSIKLISVC